MTVKFCRLISFGLAFFFVDFLLLLFVGFIRVSWLFFGFAFFLISFKDAKLYFDVKAENASHTFSFLILVFLCVCLA